jgi:hypothetical protein
MHLQRQHRLGALAVLAAAIAAAEARADALALDVGDEHFCASRRAKGYEVPFTPKKWIICE